MPTAAEYSDEDASEKSPANDDGFPMKERLILVSSEKKKKVMMLIGDFLKL